MTNRKAQGISINIIVILVLALMALLLVGGFFTGWFSRAGGGISEVGTGAVNASGEANISGKLKSITSIWDEDKSEGEGSGT